VPEERMSRDTKKKVQKAGFFIKVITGDEKNEGYG